jgi:hypothetical protein
VEQNHSNVYETLLRSLNIYMPPVTSEEFIKQDLLPSAYIQPVFQLCVGLFPEEFFPELLGMTLYLEWEATPTLTPQVRHLKRRRIDAHFYSLHVAIDNISVGHGALAKEAIKLYLAKAEDEGTGVQELWERIWCGYVTWATAGNLGLDLLELCLLIDHKQIDRSYPMRIVPETITNAPDLLSKLRAEPRDPFSQYLLSRFKPETRDLIREYEPGEPVRQVLFSALVDELNLIIQGENIYSPERFTHVALSEETKKLIASNPEEEEQVRLNRVLLVEAYPGEIAQIPDAIPDWFPDYGAYYRKRMIDLIRQKAPMAKQVHRRITVAGRILAELFENPHALLEALRSDGWIDLKYPRSSKFFSLTDFRGPMYKVFTDDEKSIILDWIESLDSTPVRPEPDPVTSPRDWAEKVRTLIADNAVAGAKVVGHRQFQFPDENGTPKPLNEWFGDPQGMMAALKRAPGWVRPGDGAGSDFYRQFVGNGPMSWMGVSVANTIKRWIDTGALVPGEEDVDVPSIEEAAAARLHITPAPTGPTGAPTAGPLPVRAGFAQKRKLIGMGAVH